MSNQADNNPGAVLVTGSSRGIGKAIALRIAQQGYDVVLHCRSKVDEAQQVQQQIEALGRRARILQFDIADRDQSRTILLDDIEQHGSLLRCGLQRRFDPRQCFPGDVRR